MKSKHIAKAIGVLSALSEEYYDKGNDYEGQPTEWHHLRSVIHILKTEIETFAKMETKDATP